MRKILLYSSALILGLGGVAEAACIQTPSCSSLGYESTSSCTGGLKCPFGNAWNCTLINKITELEKIIEEIKQNGTSNPDILADCQIGDILYSDKTCNTNMVASKTPIAVIFDTTNKLAMALDDTYSEWSLTEFDVPGVTNISSSSAATGDWKGKENTQTILKYCQANGYNCPAFEYVNSYTTEGTKAGDWYLPAMGELNAIYKNQDILFAALDKVGGQFFLMSDFGVWSSSEISNRYAWNMHFVYDKIQSNYSKSGNSTVHPIMNYGEWANGSSGGEESKPDYSNCKIGSILYDDMTCSMDAVAGKTPIAVVAYIGPSGYQAMAISMLGDFESQGFAGKYIWGGKGIDILGLQNFTSKSDVIKDFDSCGNTAKIVAAGDKNKYPAAWAAYEYKTSGTKAGDWCLPAAGVFTSYLNNKEAINSALIRANGEAIPSNAYFWTSSEYNADDAWYVNVASNSIEYGFGGGMSLLKNGYTPIWPVLQF